MKTKLLKKIRKKYSVVEITDPRGIENNYIRDFISKYPTYAIETRNLLEVEREYGFNTKDKALSYILDIVRTNYHKKVKGRNRFRTKVWWNE